MAIPIHLINTLYMVVPQEMLIMISMARATALYRDSGLSAIGEPKTGWQEDIVIDAGFESILWKGN